MISFRSWVLAGIVGFGLVGAQTTAEPSAPMWSLVELKRRPMPWPRCFAHATGAFRGFACHGYAGVLDERGRQREASIDLIGFERGGRPWSRSYRMWSNRPARLHSAAAMNRALARRGFRQDGLRAVHLQPDEWMPIGRRAARLNVHLHEGDASYEYFGNFEVRCKNGRTVAVDVRERGLELGELARLFWIPGTGLWALSVHGSDGGEGHDDYFLGTVVFDVAALCAGKDAVAGPIDGRSIGP